MKNLVPFWAWMMLWKAEHRSFLIATSTFILLAFAVSWFAVSEISRRSLLRQLPVLADISARHPTLIDEITRMDREVRAEPQSVDKLARLGLTYQANDMFLKARNCFALASLLSPDDYRWPYYLAITEEALGHEERAIELLRRVTQLQPGYVHTWARLGNLLRRSSRLTEARAALDTARHLDPLHPQACLGLARIAESLPLVCPGHKVTVPRLFADRASPASRSEASGSDPDRRRHR
jgi:cytochrome c-type biogenesis protein CcmH/NrfG